MDKLRKEITDLKIQMSVYYKTNNKTQDCSVFEVRKQK